MKRTAYALLLATVLARPAGAAPVIAARSAVQGDHSRIVFTAPAAESYTVEKQDGALVVTFAAPATLTTDKAAAGAPADDPRIGDITVDAASHNLRVRIAVPPDARYQDFSAGNRIILDVYGEGKASAAVTPAPEKPAPEKATPEKTMPEKTTPEKTVIEKPVTPPPAKTETVVAIPTPAKTPAPPPPPNPPTAPTTNADAATMPSAPLTMPPAAQGDLANIAFVLTEPKAAAAFVRNGQLWLVLAPGGVFSPPKVTGPRAGDLATFRRLDLPGGVAFTAPLPAGTAYEIYGEGGGLVWRVVLSPLARDVHPVAMRRDTANGAVSAAWPLQGVSDVIDLPDPDTGDTLKVAVVKDASQFSGPLGDTVDFTALRAAIGLAIVEKADNLTVTRTDDGVQITRAGGLALSTRTQSSLAAVQKKTSAFPSGAAAAGVPPAQGTPIFNLAQWATPSLATAQANERSLLAHLAGKNAQGRAEDLITIAKMEIANDRGAEATGFLDYAENGLPALTQAAQFEALRGAAEALLGRYEDSLAAFSAPDLKPYGELGYWRAYDLAWLGDWRQAKALLPAGSDPIAGYPQAVRDRLLPKLVEIDLHAGDLKAAKERLHVLEIGRSTGTAGAQAGLDYLKGEAAYQAGDKDLAHKLWTPLVTGPDHLYRVRAGLVLTALELQNKEITPGKAIDRLEGLRYTWRGDELEAAINFALGKLYIQNGKYFKGFDILRDAITMDPDSDVGRDIGTFMRTQFIAVLMQDKKITPVESAELYEDFPELIPPGADGDRLGQRIAERLVDGDMLGRAAAILQKQVDHTLQGEEKARIAARLADIYLLDKEAKMALQAAQVAEQSYNQLPGDPAKKAAHHAQLQQARSLAQGGKADDALTMLEKFPPDPEMNALRADIAWTAGLWDKAAAALQDMIIDEIQDPNAPLTQGQADIILNRAVALNLSGNRVALANLHARYADAMSRTSRGKLFDIVARPRESALLSDKETLNAIVNEVDIYKGFLDSYRGAGTAR